MSCPDRLKGRRRGEQGLGDRLKLMPQVRPQPGRHQSGLIGPRRREGVGKAHADTTGEPCLRP
jgi:hypothetical protein